MIKVSYYKNGRIDGTPEKSLEMEDSVALHKMITFLCYSGFILDSSTVESDKGEKDKISKIVITTHCLGPIKPPYTVIFEGFEEGGGSTLGLVATWYAMATKSATPELLKKFSS